MTLGCLRPKVIAEIETYVKSAYVILLLFMI
jgi:hypothetical protein